MSGKRSRDDPEEVVEAVRLVCGRTLSASDAAQVSLTPLERQMLDLKRSLPPYVLLLVACGYRVKCFGRDSRVVSRRTGVMVIHSQPFEYSSFPYTRVEIYIERLVNMGYHVAFADQESAAVRAAEGVKGKIFSRSVSRLYSRGTLLAGERVQTTGTLNAEATTSFQGSSSAAEEGEEEGDSQLQDIAFTPQSSQDTHMLFLQLPSNREDPLEVIVVSFTSRTRLSLTVHTNDLLPLEDVLQRYAIVELIIVPQWEGEQHPGLCGSGLLQQLPEDVLSLLHRMMAIQTGPSAVGEEDSGVVALSCATKAREGLEESICGYLSQYGLGAAFKGLPNSTLFKQEELTTMELTGSTLRALELFHSGGRAGKSLYWFLNHTQTAAGARCLREWLAAPLISLSGVLQRQAAVRFLTESEGRNEDSELGFFVKESSRAGDVEAVVGRIHTKRCAVWEYIRLLHLFDRLAKRAAGNELRLQNADYPDLIKGLIACISSSGITAWLDRDRHLIASTATTPTELFSGALSEESETCAVHVAAAATAQQALDDELAAAQTLLHMPQLAYRIIAGTPYILDLPASKASLAGKDWIVLSRTKSNVRFHTPLIERATTALHAAQERMAEAARAEWGLFQEKTAATHCDAISTALKALAALDALSSLAAVSRRKGFVAPSFSGGGLTIVQGRHPVADALMDHHYVPCDMTIAKGGTCLLTGPNCGGKSALMRMIGVFTILAQIGCFVPATSASLPLFQGVSCRMGATDSILEGQSTFMSEMVESSRILTSPSLGQSLVLMDELGRGTSSFDGMAVAAATLEYLVEHGATTVFVTHYTALCEPYLSSSNQTAVVCCYMGFHEEIDAASSERRLTFTYVPCKGVAPSSFGVEVARLAGISSAITHEASLQSQSIQRSHGIARDVAELLSFLRNA